MLTRFLFWNINRKPLAAAVAALAKIHRADLVVLADCEIEPGEVQMALNQDGKAGFDFPRRGLNRQLLIFTRFSSEFLKPRFDSARVSIRRLALPERAEILLAVAHFPSKLHWTSDSQTFECSKLARSIVDEEKQAGHQRTVLLGDFNMNPFEPGLVGAGGLNAVMSRQIASRTVRTVQGRKYPFFYNPMWGALWRPKKPHRWFILLRQFRTCKLLTCKLLLECVRSGFNPSGVSGTL